LDAQRIRQLEQELQAMRDLAQPAQHISWADDADQQASAPAEYRPKVDDIYLTPSPPDRGGGPSPGSSGVPNPTTHGSGISVPRPRTQVS